jgi:hypothetical protein
MPSLKEKIKYKIKNKKLGILVAEDGLVSVAAHGQLWVVVASGWGESEDGDGRRYLGISIFGEIWIVPFF